MIKKILMSVIALVAVAGSVAGLSAFEAHVINVTAQIENALSVQTDAIDFGTVFPQEHLEQPLTVELSSSFLAEDRVDDVEYFIRQKPKCAITSDDGESFDAANTATGHVVVGDNPDTDPEVEDYYIDCGEAPRSLENDESWGVLPSLCEYISKDGGDEDGSETQNDDTLASFHTPWEVVGDQIVWTDTKGRLAKSANDEIDEWIIDLAVPCFGDHCAQDWEAFVASINPRADASAFILDEELEHKIFGCDLWIEVSGVNGEGGVQNPRGELSITQSTTDEALAEHTTLGGVAGNVTHLKAERLDGTHGDEARLVIEASEVGISTLSDLDTISWDAFDVTGYAPHVDVIVDTGGGEDALVFEYAKIDAGDCDNAGSYPLGDFNTFDGKGIVNSTAYGWLGSGPAGPCGDGTFDANHMSLADWKSTGTAGIDGSTTVLRFEVEVDNWIESSEAYIQNILINGI